MTIYKEAPLVSKMVTVPFNSDGISVEIYENTFQVILTYLPNASNPRICYFAFGSTTTNNFATATNYGSFSAGTSQPQRFTIEPSTRRALGKTMYLVTALSSGPSGDNHLCVTQVLGSET